MSVLLSIVTGRPTLFNSTANLWAIGFGKMEDETTPSRLQHVELKYISNSDCTSDPYDYSFEITDEMMCARDNGSKFNQGLL